MAGDVPATASCAVIGAKWGIAAGLQNFIAVESDEIEGLLFL